MGGTRKPSSKVEELDKACTKGLFFVDDYDPESYIQKGVLDENLYDPSGAFATLNYDIFYFELIRTADKTFCNVWTAP